jgi:hypothetical protein
VNGIRSYLSGMSLVLLLASGLLGGLLYLQWKQDVASQYELAVKPVDSVATESEAQQVPPFVPAPINSLREITERPLFTEGRIPPEKPTDTSESKVPVAPLRLKLEGVAITPQNKVAVITDQQTNELLRLSQGMSHGNWKVTGVNEESVTIQQGPKEITLKLEIDEASGSAGKRPSLPFKIPVRPSLRR